MTYNRNRHKFAANPNEEQVANANPDFPNLTPVSEEPAERVRNAWAALLPQPEDYAEDAT